MSYVCYMTILWNAWNHSKNDLNYLKYIFAFKSFSEISLIYKDGKSELQKRRCWEKILEQYAKEPIFKDKE